MKKSIVSIAAATAIAGALVLGAALPAQASVPRSYGNALAQAKSYVRLLNISKQHLYVQLHSSYGSGFSAAAAHYGADHVTANWNKEALGAAKSYEKLLHLSDANLFTQLTSSYGDQFTSAQAHWAIRRL